MKRAVIFDMDGVMIDSEPIQMRAFETLMGDYGVEVDKSIFLELVGKRSIDNFRELRVRYGLSPSAEELNDRKSVIYHDILLRGLADGTYGERDGLSPLLEGLAEAGFALALATSSPVADIDIVTEGLSVRDRFAVLTSGDEVENGKPAPDVFLLAARRLGIDPARCAVVEDSAPGVEAARNAGMAAVAVPNEFTESQDFSRAQHRAASLRELGPELFARLIEANGGTA